MCNYVIGLAFIREYRLLLYTLHWPFFLFQLCILYVFDSKMSVKELDEKLKWLETRINSSLRPRNEDLKHMFSNDENKLAFHEFFNNEDVRRLFVYVKPSKQLVASLQPPHDLKFKSIFFLKNSTGIKLTKENLSEYWFNCQLLCALGEE